MKFFVVLVIAATAASAGVDIGEFKVDIPAPAWVQDTATTTPDTATVTSGYEAIFLDSVSVALVARVEQMLDSIQTLTGALSCPMITSISGRQSIIRTYAHYGAAVLIDVLDERLAERGLRKTYRTRLIFAMMDRVGL